MKWFFALNGSSAAFDDYCNLIRVAVHTARRATTLEPHCLFDGPECAFTDWLHSAGVTVIHCRSRFYDDLAQIGQEREDPYVLSIGAGAFLRCELPRLGAVLGFGSETVLYTDCDVMFRGDPALALGAAEPRLFAVTTEINRENLLQPNTGVMLMNLRGLAQADAAFTAFTRRHLALFTRYREGAAWDQDAYRLFFHPAARRLLDLGVSLFWTERIARRVSVFARPCWEPLPEASNWKPYWGIAPVNTIVHFHGPKPTDPNAASNPHCGHLASGAFDSLAEDWRKALAEGRDSAPTSA